MSGEMTISISADNFKRFKELAGLNEKQSRKALQKYPEQSFAQQFILCNRQEFSGRKIKEGF